MVLVLSVRDLKPELRKDVPGVGSIPLVNGPDVEFKHFSQAAQMEIIQHNGALYKPCGLRIPVEYTINPPDTK